METNSETAKAQPGSLHPVVSKPPNRIYLQWVGDGDREEGHRVDDADVTWCRDRIFRQDYVYVRLRSRKRKAANSDYTTGG